MGPKIKNKYYDIIEKKISDGIFTKGDKCYLQKYHFEGDIRRFPTSERTPEVCASLMAYGKCGLSDVPTASRTREFFISEFSNSEVGSYIEKNISNFDRQFFKDLIETNEYATHFERNCFAIMPVEYIDEEMCSLAILRSTDWSGGAWFFSVYKRKPEALTADLWKLGARLYSRLSGKENRFLNITPEEYRDEDYYKEMCSCNFNCGMKLDTNKGQIMNSIPYKVITQEFLLDLLEADIDNVARFSEKALETEVIYNRGKIIISQKIWQFLVSSNGDTIKYMALNDERVEYFLSHYDKDSSEYRWSFKDNYKTYMKKKNDAEALAQTRQRTQQNLNNIVSSVLTDALAYSTEGEGPAKAIETETDRREVMSSSFIPIKYRGIIPQELCKDYDSEEYLLMLYKNMGIEIVAEHDNLFYRVNLPEGWTRENEGYWNNVKDNNGKVVIEYFYDSKFYDIEAYVNTVYIFNLEIEDRSKKMIKSAEKIK